MKNICSIFIMLSLFIFALVQQGVAGSVEEVEEFFTEIIAAAERGDVGAQTTLGIMYERGIGVSPDPAKALEWFRAAADRDDPSGQSLVGRAYADGRGVPHDDEEALVWFHKGAQSELREFAKQGLDNLVIRFAAGYEGAIKAAESGNAMAQTTVGKMYLTGTGVTQNDVEAVRWLTEGTNGFAAAGAENALAIMYEEGRGGLPKDNAEAMRLYRKAAEQLARIAGSGLTMICLTLTGQADCRGTGD